jgi:hypothetical protein
MATSIDFFEIKKEEGKKYDQGKERFDLIPARPLFDLADVFTYGAVKYEDRNWEKGISYSRIFAAIMRHLWKWWKGENIDHESILPHLAHAAWGCFVLLEYERTHREKDDRQLSARVPAKNIDDDKEEVPPAL